MCSYRHTLVWGCLALLALASARVDAGSYDATFLVSNVPDLAVITDPLLKNPWGVSYGPTSPFWVSNAGSGTATLYSGTDASNFTKVSLEVSIPGGNPSGQVFNGTNDFSGSHFIFAGLNGTINSWTSGTTADLQATVKGSAYTGIAMGQNSEGLDFLFAANARAGRIDVFDATFQRVDTGDGFTDPELDPNFSPFNIQNIGGTLFVTYTNIAEQDRGGVINMFDMDGNFMGRFADGGTLNSPWGMALAPDNFGDFSNALLVGGFGDGRISAFDPNTGAFLGLLKDDDGNPWVFERLWTLIFGNGGQGGDPNTLYFTAGINNEQDGLLGSLQPTP
ncbi:MAG TPA: TIGR03118 family protein [Gemmataceae bacterium]|nr:TIGR03118 family protein [Gemmataceae bacterium]